MTAILQPRHSPAAEWARRLGAFSTVLFLTSALSHRFGLIDVVPFLWLLGLCGALAFSGLCLAVVGFVHFWEHGISGLKSASTGAFLCAFVLVPYGVSAYRLLTNPRLVDVSTDVLEPPEFVRAAELRAPPMNPLLTSDELATRIAMGSYPMPSGRRYEHAVTNVAEAVGALAVGRGWKLLSPLPSGNQSEAVTLEAVARSYVLGFPSDVAIRIEERSDTTYVDMRSASRFGAHDLGDNRRRVERFLGDLDARLEALGNL